MKKKISLRMELVMMMLIALIISITAAIVIRNQGVGIHYNDAETRMEKVYAECIPKLKEELLQCDLSDKDEVLKLLQGQYGFLVGYEFYIVDETGKVMAGSSSDVESIQPNKITDGQRAYAMSTADPNVFRVDGCQGLKDKYYLYYTYLKYDENDTGMLIGALIGALICFFFFVWGRISYISVIRASVAQIAKGDLTYRVPYHYKNELRGLAEDINQMADSLENEEQKKNEFLTNISHDIRTPLTTILGYLEMIKKEKYDSKEELEAYMNTMERKGKFLASMLEDFFQYSKLASKDVPIEHENFELNELLRQFYEDEADEFAAKGLTLQLDLYEQSISCNGDTELLARVVNNLLMNALKYSKKDTIVTVKSTMEKVNHITYGGFSVSNIPREAISHQEVELLFERLYKRDGARSEEGSGLGLSIVKNIIKLHGGIVKGYKDGETIVFKVLLKV